MVIKSTANGWWGHSYEMVYCTVSDEAHRLMHRLDGLRRSLKEI